MGYDNKYLQVKNLTFKDFFIAVDEEVDVTGTFN